MRKLIALLILIVPLGIASIANAEPLEDGLAAIGRGDFATALRLLKPLSDKGDAKAQVMLGQMYESGQGVTQDFILAYMWLNIGASSLSGEFGEQAATARDSVAKKMKPGQIERAQEMARKCQASNFENCD